MITLYGISNCDTIKKARRWLENAGLEYEFHDYKKLGCSNELARALLAQFDLDKLINKRGTTWRNLTESEKSALTVDTAVPLMSQQPSVIKRPVLHAGPQWRIGFDEKDWELLFKLTDTEK